MKLLLDADGLIKLQRAGVLERVAREFECTIPDAVYHETVTRGKGRLYSDAEEIEGIVKEAVTIRPVAIPETLELGLGAGEMAALALTSHGEEELIVVSDDRRFLALLTRQGIPFLTPADLIALMAQQGSLAMNDARDALDRLRPLVREKAYLEAVQYLERPEEKNP